MRVVAQAFGPLAAVLAALMTGGVVVLAQSPTSTSLAPVQARTIALSRCGTSGLSTPSAECRGFDARDIRESTDIFVVGFENNQEIGEKHVLEVVLVFDLGQIAIDENSEVSLATLGYGEASTTRRSPTGDSEYGVLRTCNTRLGAATGAWNGRTDALVATQPALVAGVQPATTGEGGSWDVTPQVKAWLAAGQKTGTLVMTADDLSPEIRGQSMCLSYVFDMGLAVEVAPKS